MPKAQNKTQPTKQSVTAFINALPSEEHKRQARALVKIFRRATGLSPVMWGNMVGFGRYHYKYDSGREGDFLATGFAMRKNGPTIYIMPGYQDYTEILADLGPHKLGKSCLYLKDLSQVNISVLQKLIRTGLHDLKKTYPVFRK